MPMPWQDAGKNMDSSKNKLSAQDNAFLTLLRSGLWDTQPDLSLFPLSGTEWNEVFRKSRSHTVSAIVADALEKLPESMLPPERLIVRWGIESERVETANCHMDNVLEKLTSAYLDYGIAPVYFKGQECARLYRKPHSRECGDIDFYFYDSLAESVEMARRSGYKPERKADGSWTYEVEGITVEHHPEYIDISDPTRQDWLRSLDIIPGFELRENCTFCPSPLLNLLLLQSHIMKHAYGRGIGLRQLCDLARAYYTYKGSYRGSRLQFMYFKSGILRWTRMMHSLLTSYLGLPNDCLPYDEPPEDPSVFMRMVLRSGNFGRDRNEAMEGKVDTLTAFIRNARFALGYSPREYLWTIVNLAKGQA